MVNHIISDCMFRARHSLREFPHMDKFISCILCSVCRRDRKKSKEWR